MSAPIEPDQSYNVYGVPEGTQPVSPVDMRDAERFRALADGYRRHEFDVLNYLHPDAGAPETLTEFADQLIRKHENEV